MVGEKMIMDEVWSCNVDRSGIQPQLCDDFIGARNIARLQSQAIYFLEVAALQKAVIALPAQKIQFGGRFGGTRQRDAKRGSSTGRFKEAAPPDSKAASYLQ